MESASDDPTVPHGKSPAGADVRRLVDSAFVLAILSACCYAVGRLVNLRDAGQLGIPSHLLPVIPPETTLLIGALHLLVLTLAVLFFYVFSLLLLKLVPAKIVRSFGLGLQTVFARHPRLYPLLGVIFVVSVLFITVFWLPLSYTSYYDDRHLPDVVVIGLKDNQLLKDKANLKYLGSSDDLFVLKRSRKKEFIVLRREDLTLMVLSRSNDAEARPIVEPVAPLSGNPGAHQGNR